MQVGYSKPMSASKLRLYHRLQLAAHRAQKAADRALLAAADITTAQAAVLSVVTAAGDGVSQREVARQLGINESAVTAMTTRLLRMGLLDRARDGGDARAWHLSLSDQGRAALKRIETPFKGVNQTIERVLDAEAMARLAEDLTRLAAAFDER